MNFPFPNAYDTKLPLDVRVKVFYRFQLDFEGLGAREAFNRTVTFYRAEQPETDGWIIPKLVARILNPSLAI